jgi:resuscitation-promoting factor RpfA
MAPASAADAVPARSPALGLPPSAPVATLAALAVAPALASELEALPHLPEAPPAVREVRARPASLWRRAGALLLDSAIVFGVFALYLELAMLIVRPASVRGAQLPGLDGLVARLHAVHGVLPPAMVLGALLAVVYSSVFAFLWGGRSPGRWLFGIRLVDKRGQAPAPGRAVARALLGLVSFGLCLAGFWLSLFDRRGQTLHDKLTRTFVVRPG